MELPEVVEAAVLCLLVAGLVCILSYHALEFQKAGTLLHALELKQATTVCVMPACKGESGLIRQPAHLLRGEGKGKESPINIFALLTRELGEDHANQLFHIIEKDSALHRLVVNFVATYSRSIKPYGLARFIQADIQLWQLSLCGITDLAIHQMSYGEAGNSLIMPVYSYQKDLL